MELRFIPASSKLTLFETAIPDNKVYVITEIRRRTDIQSAKKATSTGQSIWESILPPNLAILNISPQMT